MRRGEFAHADQTVGRRAGMLRLVGHLRNVWVLLGRRRFRDLAFGHVLGIGEQIARRGITGITVVEILHRQRVDRLRERHERLLFGVMHALGTRAHHARIENVGGLSGTQIENVVHRHVCRLGLVRRTLHCIVEQIDHRCVVFRGIVVFNELGEIHGHVAELHVYGIRLQRIIDSTLQPHELVASTHHEGSVRGVQVTQKGTAIERHHKLGMPFRHGAGVVENLDASLAVVRQGSQWLAADLHGCAGLHTRQLCAVYKNHPPGCSTLLAAHRWPPFPAFAVVLASAIRARLLSVAILPIK